MRAETGAVPRGALKWILPIGLAGAVLTLIVVDTLPPVFGLAVLVILTALVYWPLRARIHAILIVFMGVFLTLVVLDNPAPRFSESSRADHMSQSWIARGPFDDRLPAFIHLVFDEMMSPGAIDETLPEGPSARADLYTLGERYDLRTYDAVYSRAFFSGVSIPNLFNAEYLGKTGVADRFPKLLLEMPQNAYFDDMQRRGYRTIVFQTSLLDFCRNASVDRCETFPSFDPGVLGPGVLDQRSHVVHVASVLLRSYEPSYVSRYGRRMLTGDQSDADIARKTGTEERFDVQGFTTWFDRFLGFVERMPRGTHVFAHFMVPHAPYLLTAGCTPVNDGGAGYYLGQRFPNEKARVDARRAEYGQYFAQLRCVTNRIAAFFDAVERNPALRDARIIIHGDHGSRISVGNQIEDYHQQDYVDNYATYFAVRAPGVARGIDCEFLSLAEAFRAHVVPGGLGPLDRPAPAVVVQSKAGEKVLVERLMPRFGCTSRGGAAPR